MLDENNRKGMGTTTFIFLRVTLLFSFDTLNHLHKVARLLPTSLLKMSQFSTIMTSPFVLDLPMLFTLTSMASSINMIFTILITLYTMAPLFISISISFSIILSPLSLNEMSMLLIDRFPFIKQFFPCPNQQSEKGVKGITLTYLFP